MTTPTPASAAKNPWWMWLLLPVFLPVMLPIAMLSMIPLGILAAFFIPYFLVYPDRHAQLHDFEGTPRQQQRLAQWRTCYAKLTLLQRVARAFKLWRRRRRHRPYRKKGPPNRGVDAVR